MSSGLGVMSYSLVLIFMRNNSGKAWAAFEIKEHYSDLPDVYLSDIIALLEALENEKLITLASGDNPLRRWKINV